MYVCEDFVFGFEYTNNEMICTDSTNSIRIVFHLLHLRLLLLLLLIFLSIFCIKFTYTLISVLFLFHHFSLAHYVWFCPIYLYNFI